GRRSGRCGRGRSWARKGTSAGGIEDVSGERRGNATAGRNEGRREERTAASAAHAGKNCEETRFGYERRREHGRSFIWPAAARSIARSGPAWALHSRRARERGDATFLRLARPPRSSGARPSKPLRSDTRIALR